MKFTEIRVKFFEITAAYDLEGPLLSPTGYKSTGFTWLCRTEIKTLYDLDGESEKTMIRLHPYQKGGRCDGD